MADRRSVWSDPRAIELAGRFVPAADEVWRLQTGNGPECRFFQAMANRGHYQAPGGTRQGIYICAPSGKLLASVNSLDPKEVCSTLERGLANWERQPRSEGRLPAEIGPIKQHRWEDAAPRDGLILISTNRDLHSPPTPSAPRIDRWNRDHAWFSRAEARLWAPPQPSVGAKQVLPDALLRRLVQFHLVDNVRGQCIPFSVEDIAGSKLETEIVARQGDVITLKIAGRTQAVSGDAWSMSTSVWKPEPGRRRGLATQVRGRATFDLKSAAFQTFELIAVGQRWGHSENNARGPDSQPSPIGFCFSQSPAASAGAIPPAFIEVYNAEWQVPP